MKKFTILIGIVLALVCNAPAYGQLHTDDAVVVVPFEFVVHGTVLPAGTYALSMNVQTHTLILLHRNAEASAVSPTHDIFPTSSDAGLSAKLIFASDGQRPVLHQLVLKHRRYDLIHGPEVAELTSRPET